MPDQPVTEAALGAPLQLDRDGNEVVVAIRNGNDRLIELKRFRHEP